METVLFVSSVFLWGIVLLNLLLTLALVRRVNAAPSLHREQAAGLPTGELAPAFAAQTLTGETLTLADYAGRATALVFVAPGCKACHELIPTLHTLEPYARQAKVTLVLISDGEREQIQTMMEAMPIRLPLLVAPRVKNTLFHDYQINGTPSYCFIDEQGTVQSAGHAHLKAHSWKALTDSWIHAAKKEVVNQSV